MPGPPPKPADRRMGHRDYPMTVIGGGVSNSDSSDVAGRIVPAAPEGLTGELPAMWADLWASPLAAVFDPVTDVPGLSRLFRLYADIARIKELFDGEELATGSQGQLILHPYAKLLATWDAEARALEDRYGMNPKARLQLGISLGNAAKAFNNAARPKPNWEEVDASNDAADEARAG